MSTLLRPMPDHALAQSRRDPAVLGATLCANVLALAIPLAMIQIYDRVIPRAGVETLAALGLIVAGAILGESLVRAARSYLMALAAERFERDAYGRALTALMMEDPAAGGRLTQGQIHARLAAIDRLRSQHEGGVALALVDLPFAALFLLVIVLLSPELGLLAVLLLCFTFLCLRTARERVRALQADRRHGEERRHSFVAEVLRNVEMVKGLGVEDFMARRYERLMGAASRVTSDLSRSVHGTQAVTATVAALAPLLMASAGAWLAIHGQMTIGALAAVVMLTGRTLQPVLRVEAWLSGQDDAREARAELSDLLALPQRAAGLVPLPEVTQLDLSRTGAQAADAPPLPPEAAATLCLRKGDCLLVDGGDAITRSAALRLLQNEMSVPGTQVLLNGKPAAQWRLADRQDRIVRLEAGAGLLEGSLIDNITGFRRSAYRDKAVHLATMLGIDRFVSQSPEGYAMRVGPNAAAALPRSIADACAIVAGLVSDPDVILFDEANATLDHEMDQRLLAELRRRARSCILVIVSSRPSYRRLATQTLHLGDAAPVPTAGGEA